MRKQSGFTLIELMVVMAIIAILATAGLSAYGGYLKKARDTTRIADISAIESIILSSLSVSGSAPDWDPELEDAIKSMNNGVLITDPQDNKNICLGEFSTDTDSTCEYQYAACLDGGYYLSVRFESASNHSLYTQDKLNTATSGLPQDDRYELGNCDDIDGNGVIDIR